VSRIAAKLLSVVSDVIANLFGCTDTGRTRTHNEDAFLVADLTSMQPIPISDGVVRREIGERGILLMVADGMGGAAAGEVASALAVETVLDSLRTQTAAPSDGASPAALGQQLFAATHAANDRIYRHAADHPATRGMGTTATVAGAVGDTLFVVQVGDSRAYLIRDGHAEQLTTDQSLLQQLVAVGSLTAEQADASVGRNIILQALGTEPTVVPELTTQILRRGDVVVICSDGLSSVVPKQELARIVTAAPDVASACREAIAAANAQGGPDNITVIVAQFLGTGLVAMPPRSVVLGPLVVPARASEGSSAGLMTRLWHRLRRRGDS
jgi:serine/threonine protein phosphatase PrpC